MIVFWTLVQFIFGRSFFISHFIFHYYRERLHNCCFTETKRSEKKISGKNKTRNSVVKLSIGGDFISVLRLQLGDSVFFCRVGSSEYFFSGKISLQLFGKMFLIVSIFIALVNVSLTIGAPAEARTIFKSDSDYDSLESSFDICEQFNYTDESKSIGIFASSVTVVMKLPA